MSRKILLRKIVKNPESIVPRMFLYYKIPDGKRTLIPGVDFEGYLVQDSASGAPFFVRDNKQEYLTASEIKEMHRLFKKLPPSQASLIPKKFTRRRSKKASLKAQIA